MADIFANWERVGIFVPNSMAASFSSPLDFVLSCRPSFRAASACVSPAVSRAQARTSGFTFGIRLSLSRSIRQYFVAIIARLSNRANVLLNSASGLSAPTYSPALLLRDGSLTCVSLSERYRLMNGRAITRLAARPDVVGCVLTENPDVTKRIVIVAATSESHVGHALLQYASAGSR